MAYKCFEVAIEDNIAHIVLNRPEKRNSMITEFWQELPAIVSDIDSNAKARVIVISSTGPHFTAGLDLATLQSAAAESAIEKQRTDVAFYHRVLDLQQAFTCLEQARIPVLVCIQGGAIGGGVDLAVACDIRYATEDAFLTIHETNIAITADVGTFPRLCKLIPEGYVREMAYTGRRVSAQEAKDMGLLNAVYPDQATMLSAVMDIARQIASQAPMAVWGCKRMINYARDHSTSDSLDYIALWNTSMLDANEIQEAVLSKAEGETAKFRSLPKTSSATNTSA